MSNCIDLENDVVCHGLGGDQRDFEEYQVPMNDIVNEQFTNYMQRSLYNLLEGSASYLPYNNRFDRIVFSLYRLQDILRSQTIKTFSDVKKEENSLICNGEERFGVFNGDDELCFSMLGHNFYEGSKLNICFSCDAGDSYGRFIVNSISVMLAYDDTFKSYEVSDNLKGVFKDEIRIKGSIKDPNIVAIGVPLIHDMRSTKAASRFEIFSFYKKLIALIRVMLDGYDRRNIPNGFDCSNIMIVDSKEGYNLEMPIIMTEIEHSLYDDANVYYDRLFHRDAWTFGDRDRERIKNALQASQQK